MSSIREEVAHLLQVERAQVWTPAKARVITALLTRQNALRVSAAANAAQVHGAVVMGRVGPLRSVVDKAYQWAHESTELETSLVSEAALEAMTPRQREIIHLRAAYQMPYDQIAKRLKLTTKQVVQSEIKNYCVTNLAIDAVHAAE